MLLKGIVMKIKENYAIVLTDDNEYMRINLKNNLAVGQKIMFTNDDVFINQNRWGDITMMKKLVAAAAVFVFLIAGGIGYNSLFANQGALQNVVAFVTVDINPSIQISVDADNKVVEAKALNDDGETLDLTELIGIDVDEAVELIVADAREAGYLDVEDLVDDFVLITTIPVEEDTEEEAAKIEAKIQNKITNSKELQNVNVAMIEATMAQMTEAKQNNVPVGIVAANGGVILENEFMSVKEFFANKERIAAFVNNGEIIEKTFENKVALIEKYLNQMEAEGVNVDTIKASFQMSKKDFFEAKKLFDLAKQDYHQALKSGDENAIAAAKVVFENAEKFKDYMEENKDDIESIKDFVKEHIDQNEGKGKDEDQNNGKGNDDDKNVDKGNDDDKNVGKGHDEDQNDGKGHDDDKNVGKGHDKDNGDQDQNQNQDQDQYQDQNQNQDQEQYQDQNQNQDQNKYQDKDKEKDEDDDDDSDEDDENDNDDDEKGNKGNEDNNGKKTN